MIKDIDDLMKVINEKVHEFIDCCIDKEAEVEDAIDTAFCDFTEWLEYKVGRDCPYLKDVKDYVDEFVFKRWGR